MLSEKLERNHTSPSDEDNQYQNTKNNKKKKTILQVVPALVSGGVERGTIEIAKALTKAGHKSIVISSGGALVDALLESGSIHEEFDVASKNPFKILSNANRIADIVRRYDVDIIHARSRAPAWSCAIAAAKTKRQFITTFHGIYNFCNFIKKYYNSIMARGHIVIAVSNFVKEHIVKNYDAKPGKIHVIHRGVNHNEFSKDQLQDKDLESFKEKYNVPKFTKNTDGITNVDSISNKLGRIPIILLPARFTNWKGQIWLTKTLSEMKDKDFYCIMAGDLAKHPKYVERLKDLIAENKMQGKIQIFGNEPNVRNLYAIADIVLSTSLEPEAFGRTIIEAQSMEKLVIATSVGGASETIKNNETGFHVQPGETEQLQEKIEYCLSILGSDEEKQITSKARNDVIKNFSLDKMISSVLKIYGRE